MAEVIKEGEIITPNNEIVLTPEQKQKEFEERAKRFEEEFKPLREKYNIALGAQLNYKVEGLVPTVVLIDLKQSNATN